MDQKTGEDLIRRLAAALRGTELYSPSHPLVQRGIDAFTASAVERLQQTPSIVIGFIGDEIVVDGTRLPRGTASLIGFARDLRDRGIEKITLTRGLSRADVGHVVAVFTDRTSPLPLADRLIARGVRNVTLGRIVVDEVSDDQAGITAARRVYGTAVETAETLWNAAKSGDQPDTGAARKIIDGLARLVTQDRTSLMALTALKKYDNYTFTHMVNVAALAMAQARALNIDGPLLREFGFAALMHDIMKLHVVDGAHILRRTPEMPALAPIVAFEHHLKQDLSGYPEKIGSRKLNLCTMIVSIADVFDALRSNRPYREGMATNRIRSIMGEQGNPAFNQVLLKRFVNLMGLFPVGTLVRLTKGEIAVVTAEHPSDPFRPQVKIIVDQSEATLEEPVLANTWERNERGDHPYAVVEAVDPESTDIDPLKYL